MNKSHGVIFINNQGKRRVITKKQFRQIMLNYAKIQQVRKNMKIIEDIEPTY